MTTATPAPARRMPWREIGTKTSRAARTALSRRARTKIFPKQTEFKDSADGGTESVMRLEIQRGKDAMHGQAFYGTAVGTLGTIGATAACSLRFMADGVAENGLFIGDAWFGSVITAVAARTVLPAGKKVHVIAAIKTNHKFFPKADIERLLSESPAGSRIVLTATIEGVEEAVINAMIAAKTMTGADYWSVSALPHDQLQAVLRRHNLLLPPK